MLSFQHTLNPGDNVGNLTWGALPGCQFLYNDGFKVTTAMHLAMMLVYFQDDNPENQIGQPDYYGGDTGRECGIYYNGKLYEVDITGHPCTFRNSLPGTGANILIIG